MEYVAILFHWTIRLCALLAVLSIQLFYLIVCGEIEKKNNCAKLKQHWRNEHTAVHCLVFLVEFVDLSRVLLQDLKFSFRKILKKNPPFDGSLLLQWWTLFLAHIFDTELRLSTNFWLDLQFEKFEVFRCSVGQWDQLNVSVSQRYQFGGVGFRISH